MEPCTTALVAKIDEQMERTLHLISLLPPGWRELPPLAGDWPVGKLLGHLLDCLAGFCAVLYAVHPEPLSHFAQLRHAAVNHDCPPEEASQRIQIYRRHIQEGFALISDSSLAASLPTVFVADGEPVLTLLLGNLEHLINHKHQLFVSLKRMGVKVGTADLYQFRGV